MPKITEKFGLVQPEGHERYDIKVQNENMAKIEAALVEMQKSNSNNDNAELSAEQALEVSKQYTDEQLKNLVGSAPERLDTIDELAKAMDENSDLIQALHEVINKSAKKEELESHTGNGTVHVTSAERTAWNDSNSKKHSHDNKSILDTITQALITAWNDAVSHITDGVRHVTSSDKELWNSVSKKADASSVPTKTSDLKNDSGYITSADIDNSQNHVHSNKSVLDGITSSLLDAWNSAVNHITDTVKHITSDERTMWNTVSNKVDKVTGKGLSTNDYTTDEKSKLSGIASGANKTTIDSALSSSSTNPVQNKVIKTALDGKAASSHTHSDYEEKLKIAVFFVKDK